MASAHSMKKFGMFLWIVAFLMYLGGLLGLFSGGEFIQIHWQTWYWNALIVGVLVIGLKLGVLIMLKGETRQ